MVLDLLLGYWLAAQVATRVNVPAVFVLAEVSLGRSMLSAVPAGWLSAEVFLVPQMLPVVLAVPMLVEVFLALRMELVARVVPELAAVSRAPSVGLNWLATDQTQTLCRDECCWVVAVLVPVGYGPLCPDRTLGLYPLYLA